MCIRDRPITPNPVLDYFKLKDYTDLTPIEKLEYVGPERFTEENMSPIVATVTRYVQLTETSTG